MANASNSKPPSAFEFTKRKRWADLLITELADAIIFVLSPTCKVWFCGRAVTDLLGWKDTDIVDKDLWEFIVEEDKPLFKTTFFEAINERKELVSYSRLKNNESPAHESLFEISGKPHLVDDKCSCLFATAKPYPGRNVAMLHTFLDLKVEDQQRKMQVQQAVSSTLPSIYTTTALSAAGPSPLADTTAYYSSNVGPTLLFDPYLQTPVSPDIAVDGGGKKKRLKKTPSEQHVCITCGRTDSPEWRKGPSGPKTLCNACGLRWAKQQRKAGGDSAGGSSAGGSSHDTVSPTV